MLIVSSEQLREDYLKATFQFLLHKGSFSPMQIVADGVLFFLNIFPGKYDFAFHVNRLLFALKIQKKIKLSSAAVVISALRVTGIGQIQK